MPVVKAFAGGVVGGTLGAFLAESIDSLIAAPAPWLILIAGLSAGIGTRVACGKIRTFQTGVASAIAAILAISVVSYLAAQQSSRSAEQSMAKIATKPNFTGDGETTGEDDSDDQDELTATDDESADSASADNESAEAESENQPTEDADPEDQESGDQPSEQSDEDPPADATPNLPSDDRPAQTEPSDPAEAWIDDRSGSEESNQPTSSLPTSVVLFHCLAALAAFVLGTGSSIVADDAGDTES